MFSVEDTKKHINKKTPRNNKFNFSTILNKKYSKIIPIIIGTILIILLIWYYFYNNKNKNFNYLKLDDSKYLVYTIYENSNDDNTLTEVPVINVDAEVASKINKEITSEMTEFLNESGNKVTYEWELNGVILSLVLKMVDNNTEYNPEVKFKTYNVNLETLEQVSDSDILELYDIDEKTVAYNIQEQFKKFYEESGKEGYVDSNECDYACYLKWRGVTDYMDNINYYIKDGKLYVYREFQFYSIFGEEEFFTEEDFLFYITKKV